MSLGPPTPVRYGGRRISTPCRGNTGSPAAATPATRATWPRASKRAAATNASRFTPRCRGVSRMKTYGKHRFPGRLFVVEGIDGSGKSTQIELLQKWLESEGYGTFFSEWN